MIINYSEYMSFCITKHSQWILTECLLTRLLLQYYTVCFSVNNNWECINKLLAVYRAAYRIISAHLYILYSVYSLDMYIFTLCTLPGGGALIHCTTVMLHYVYEDRRVSSTIKSISNIYRMICISFRKS